MNKVVLKFLNGDVKIISKVWFTSYADTHYIIKTHGGGVWNIPWTAIMYAREVEESAQRVIET